MNFAEPDDGFKPAYKPAPGMPAGMSPLPKELPPEHRKPDNIPHGRGVRSKNNFPKKPFPLSPPKNLPRTIPGPNSAPRPVNPGPNIDFRKIGRDIAWEILKPTPTADGTLPDFEYDFPDPEPEPESGEKESICMLPCVPNAGWYMPNGKGDYVVSVFVGETVMGDGFPMTDGYTIPDVPRDVGFYKELASQARPEGITFQYQPQGKEWLNAQESETRDGIKYVRFIFAVQYSGELRLSRIKWTGQIGLWQTSWYLKSSGISPEGAKNDFGGTFRWRKRPSRYGEVVYCRIPFCDDNSEPEPEPDDDYDRKEDGEVPCKWQPVNDPRVASLKLVEIEYEEFRGCEYYDNGQANFTRPRTMMVPECLAETMTRVLNEQAKALGKFCLIPEPILVVPDWMPLKWANVEKLVVMYAEYENGKYKSAKYQVTIPHWGLDRDQTRMHGLQPINKGQYQLIHELKDSSRITINCATVADCNSRMLEFINGLHIDYRNVIRTNPVLRGGVQLAQITIEPVSAKFFKAGTDEIKPEWTVKLV